ncbi:MAG: phosphoribosylanthranilate isomerase [Chloroflexi bacterium]|nr:phosphoribosylanthranilate isomerase [Chloroflexota bacterium]
MMRIKICGITSREDALAAIEFGADALGFIFAESPRKVTPEIARAIIAELPPFVTKVGVFVNRPLDEIRETMAFCGLDLAQLHGEESPETCAALLPKVIKVFTPNSLPPLGELRQYPVAAYLFDREKGSKTPPEGLWPIAKRIGAYGRVILAGGLTPENVAEAIRIAQPYAVDVSSGIEERPGKKDLRKMKEFIETVRAAR